MPSDSGRKCHQIGAISVTLSDLQDHAVNEGLLNAIFRIFVQQLTTFQLA